MRELKFRAWSEETKSFEHFDLYEGTECGLTNLQIWARNNPIEQYTGLKDKNGKEIYEGDICRVVDDQISIDGITHKCRTSHNNDIVQVWWDELNFMYVYSDAKDNETLLARARGGQSPTCIYEVDVEVIGNIHENPELLIGEEKKDEE